MENSTLIIVLALFTLIAVVAIGIWQKRRATQAEKHNEHSAVTERRPDLRADDSGRNKAAAGSMADRVETAAPKKSHTADTLEKEDRVEVSARR